MPNAQRVTHTNPPLRIAFLTPEFVTEDNFDGGLATYLGRVTTALAAQGHEVVVLVDSRCSGTLTYNGVTVVRVRNWTPGARLLRLLAAGRLNASLDCVFRSARLNRACRDLHRRRPLDIVQHPSYTATALFTPGGIPAVARLSSYEPLWQQAYDQPATLDHRLCCLLERLALRRVHRVFSPSRLLADTVAPLLNTPIPVIESPFSLDHLPQPENAVARPPLPYLLFVGTIGVLKGLVTVGAILPELFRRHPKLSFVLAGDDAGFQGGSMVAHLRRQAGDQQHRLLHLGRLRPGRLLPLLQNATLVVLPSRIDNLPNACLEAMACGRVVVGTAGASFEQLITDGVSGLLCAPDDPAGLLEAIERGLAMGPAARRRMGEAAVQRVARLAPATALEPLLRLYREVIAEG